MLLGRQRCEGNFRLVSVGYCGPGRRRNTTPVVEVHTGQQRPESLATRRTAKELLISPLSLVQPLAHSNNALTYLPRFSVFCLPFFSGCT